MNKRKKTLSEINHWCKTTAVLIVNHQGILQIISCPFFVEVIVDTENLMAGDKMAVEGVKTTVELVLLYVIKNKPYPYFLFVITEE